MKSEPIPPSDSTLQGQYAGFVSRLVAFTVDVLLIIAVILIGGFVLGLLLYFFGLAGVVSELLSNLEARADLVGLLVRVLTFFGSFTFVFFLYYVSMHTAAAGMTVGKALMGVRVVRMTGYPMTLSRSIRRYFTFLLAALPFFLGLVWILIDDRRQGWHDKLSDTCVIYDWPAREDEGMLHSLRTRLRYMSETRQQYGIGSSAGDSDQPAQVDPASNASI